MHLVDPTPSVLSPTGAPPSVVDATLGRVAAAGLALGSRLRGRRVFHPDGVAGRGTLTTMGDHPVGAELFDQPGERACIVRISRGIGLPPPTPDVWGIAIRACPPRRSVQDLLFASVLGRTGPDRHLLAPARRFAERPLSTILPYRTATGLVVLSVVVDENGGSPDPAGGVDAVLDALLAGELGLRLMARQARKLVPLAALSVSKRLPTAESDTLRFNPFHAAEDLQPAGGLNALRRRSYAASQQARAVVPR